MIQMPEDTFELHSTDTLAKAIRCAATVSGKAGEVISVSLTPIPYHPGIEHRKIFRIQDEKIPLLSGINFNTADTFPYRFHQAYYHV